MNRKTFLFAAAFFTLFTFVGHSLGTLLPQQPETDALKQAYSVMESTMVEMPFGPARSLARMAYGGNAFISLYLLMSGILFLLSVKPQRYVRSIVLLNSAALVVCAVFSLVFFFPFPAICTALAAILGIFATRKQVGENE